MTAEQLEASRAERMRQNGAGTLTLEDARTWIEETGLCLFLPRKQFANFVAPSFVEAVCGERNSVPSAKVIALAEELLVRLETDGVAVRLNLQGQPGEQPDFVVATWVLPYVYALRGDRDWRRNPQLTGSRAVSPLAIQAYKLLEAGDATIPQLKQTLGREVTESGVLRAITELWQQLRIIPVIQAPGRTPQWQLLRVRYQKAIAEGASTSQVTAISVLASIYLQAVIAASMEEVELFLAPLTARSKVREVLRGLVATRQVHTISLGHAPHFYVAGTLPEFSLPANIYSASYASSAMPASSAFLHSSEREYETHETVPTLSAVLPSHSVDPAPEKVADRDDDVEPARPNFNGKPAHARNGKPASGSGSSRGQARSGTGARHSSQVRWSHAAAKKSHSKQSGSHATGAKGVRKAKPVAARGLRSGHVPAGKPATKASPRPVSRNASAARKDARTNPRTHRKPALTASTKAGNRARYGFSTPAGQRTKKRG